MTPTNRKGLVMEDHNDNFILIPAKSGGGALVRRSQVAGGRANARQQSRAFASRGQDRVTKDDGGAPGTQNKLSMLCPFMMCR